ncbi:MAG: hypothetical protein EAY65_03800 [Alphaproteobacteria bacterium]|nr:MAG: hypothetical protein EAY65_03800 [Alphaproteobacteria bacterium]
MANGARKEGGDIKATIKATQIAFEMEQKIACHIRELAAREGLTPSDQIRKMLGLCYSPPKRPRLTVSLSDADYATLGKKYAVDARDTLNIKRKMMEELLTMVADQHE